MGQVAGLALWATRPTESGTWNLRDEEARTLKAGSPDPALWKTGPRPVMGPGLGASAGCQTEAGGGAPRHRREQMGGYEIDPGRGRREADASPRGNQDPPRTKPHPEGVRGPISRELNAGQPKYGRRQRDRPLERTPSPLSPGPRLIANRSLGPPPSHLASASRPTLPGSAFLRPSPQPARDVISGRLHATRPFTRPARPSHDSAGRPTGI